MRLFAIACTALLTLAACGPVSRVPGGRLFGEEVDAPTSDWSFTDEIMTIAVETRPGFPHSITTWCFTYAGDLYIPAGRPAAKKWPELVRQNPSVRLGIDGKIYPGHLVQQTDRSSFRKLLEPLAAKYQLGELPSDPPPDIAVYRFESQPG